MTSIGGLFSDLVAAGSQILESALTYVKGEEPTKTQSAESECFIEKDQKTKDDVVDVENEMTSWRTLLQNVPAILNSRHKRYQAEIEGMKGFSRLSSHEKLSRAVSLKLDNVDVTKLTDHGNILRGLCALRWLNNLIALREEVDVYSPLDVLGVAKARVRLINQNIEVAKGELFKWISPHSMSEEVGPAFCLLLELRKLDY